MLQPIVKNAIVNGKRTSLKLEAPIWDAVDEICRIEGLTPSELFSGVAERSGENLASAVRVLVMVYFRQAATERGHRDAGHGAGDPLIGWQADRLPRGGKATDGTAESLHL
ncbi:ribbon-helix-helix domain-containing protein [Azospirillum sp. TSO35-2]|uniref:ribbon-helix-helix domain-containing protein n=1 Tax=Azospirillum sp. TSO35-2 TaxID=716796 RepID=UPI000D607470|nr:ribbon-helix-helix domain-containing protein [Azospirillum sp. TSO35-2]PWC35914.1 hypothetical protein TSO352_11890 [Azospirillum sp. TSO35-2]